MKATPLLRSFGRYCAPPLAALILSASAALAQGTGSLSGRVADSATGKSLQGAVVRVVGTTAVAYTDADGRFTMPGVAAGAHRVEIDYVGLDPVVREVTIAPGGVATLNAALEGHALKMEAFTVTESARGQSLAINQQKTASGIVNIVSEETFSQMINGNVGYAPPSSATTARSGAPAAAPTMTCAKTGATTSPRSTAIASASAAKRRTSA